MNVGDLRGGVSWWDSLWCGLSGGGGAVLMQGGVALWCRCRLEAAKKEVIYIRACEDKHTMLGLCTETSVHI